MRPTPEHVDLIFLILMFCTVVLFVIGFNKACGKAELKNPTGRTLWLMVGMLAWIMLLGFLSSAGVFSFDQMPPRLPILLISALIALLIINKRPATRRLAKATPLHWPILLQGFRFPLEVVLWMLFTANALPIQMTYSGYNYDILSGILGIVVGLAVYQKWLRSRKVLIAYNVIGLILLFTIVAIAVLSMPLPIRQFMNEPSNTIVAFVPYIWLPGVFVLLAFFLHIFSLRQLFIDPDQE